MCILGVVFKYTYAEYVQGRPTPYDSKQVQLTIEVYWVKCTVKNGVLINTLIFTVHCQVCVEEHISVQQTLHSTINQKMCKLTYKPGPEERNFEWSGHVRNEL